MDIEKSGTEATGTDATSTEIGTEVPEVVAPVQDRPGAERTPRRWGVLAAIAAVAIVTFAAGLTYLLGRTETVTITARPGIGNELEVGSFPPEGTEPVAERIVVERGTKVTLVNKDDRLHILGPLTVAPGKSATFTLGSAGTFPYPTTLNTARSVTFVVT